VEKNGVMNAVSRDLQILFSVGVLGDLSDERLLDHFVGRRQGAAFEAIVRRHGPMVWGVCRRVLRDHHDAEDAFQATFLVLARKAASVMPREKLGNWLYGVAYQTAMKARAMRAKRRLREGQVSEVPEPMAVRDDLQDELAESIDRELSRLPEKYRTPIVLCDLDGRTHREAASQLGWPIGTVSSRLSRARSMLARRLSRWDMSLSVGSLAVWLAQESASASMPTKLIGSTAQAASLIAAGEAATAGMVSAEAVALTGEVLKVMLLGKLKIVTATLLVASALAAGGTGLAYQAQRAEPSQKEELQRLIDEKKEELQRLIDKQKQQGQQNEAREQIARARTRPRTAWVPDDRTTDVRDPKDDMVAISPDFGVGPRTEGEPRMDPLSSSAERTDAYSLDQLRRQKDYIDAMIAVEEARNKTHEQLDEMIEAKTKDLERLRWAVRVVEAQVAKLKKFRGAPLTEEKTLFRPHGAGAQ
jgi:RNA polymerase sigma factor (sigma-70 family)